jgi:cytochrome P450
MGGVARFRSIRSAERQPVRHPPHTHVALSTKERSDRKLLLSLAEKHGPVFQVRFAGLDMVCVLGLSRGRRLLKEHEAALLPDTIDLKSLFPFGFMRQMEGAVHQKYRGILVEAVQALDHDDDKEDLEIIAKSGLDAFFASQSSNGGRSSLFLASLTAISTGFLLRKFFGVAEGCDAYTRLAESFQRLGPHGLVWNIRQPQCEAFAEIQEILLELAAAHTTDGKARPKSNILQNIALRGNLDDTMIGNLIYMVEMGRYDLKGLFRWIAYYAASEPAWLKTFAEQETENPSTSRAMAKAFVQETLRMDQSELLMRDVKRDIEFEGFRIFKNQKVRICMWESHKDATHFENPFEFQPGRFLSTRKSQDAFSPFGADHHQCPFSAMSYAMGIVFLTVMARLYKVSAVNNGEPVRGAYHWEPASLFSVVLQKRDAGNQKLQSAV